MRRHSRQGLRAWVLAMIFAAWTGFVIYYYFAQFGDYFVAVLERLR